MNKFKTILAFSTIALTATVGFTNNAFATKNKIDFTNDQLFLISWMTASQITELEKLDNAKFSKDQIDLMLAAIKSNLEGMPLKYTKEETDQMIKAINEKVKVLATNKEKAEVSKNKAAGEAYLDKFKKEKGVVVTKSGLAYKIIKAGSGSIVNPTDEVTLLYKGTFTDGTVFDQTADRSKPATFSLQRVVPGFTEAVTKLKDGGKMIAVLPYNLAYGEQTKGPISGGSTLIFEIELLSHKPAPVPEVKPELKK